MGRCGEVGKIPPPPLFRKFLWSGEVPSGGKAPPHMLLPLVLERWTSRTDLSRFFSVEENGLFWVGSAHRMFMNEEVESISDFLKLSLTVTDKLPFSGNVSGDCRLKFLMVVLDSQSHEQPFWTLSSKTKTSGWYGTGLRLTQPFSFQHGWALSQPHTPSYK